MKIYVESAEGSVAVSLSLGSRQKPRIVSDAAGGVIVVWLDLRKDDYTADIYAERIDRYGILGHTGGGAEKQKSE